MTYAFDVETFLQEIQNRPVIWDVNCEDFKFKNKKHQAWEEIASVFIKDIDELSPDEKWDVFKKLQGKWRNLRDSFVRNLKKKDGRGGYLYAKNMSFLKQIYQESEQDSDEDWREETPKKGKKKREVITFKTEKTDDGDDSDCFGMKRSRVDAECPVTEFVDTPLLGDTSTNFQMEDEDRSFFESLLPAVRKFDLDQKIEFRCEVLKLVKNIRQANNGCKSNSTTFDNEFD